MTQLEVIPLRSVEYRPLQTTPTMHAIGRALGEDGNYYIVKDGPAGDLVCATEWVCNSLADSLNLPVASAKVLQTPGGGLVYGTKEIKPRLPEIESARVLLGDGGNGIFAPELKAVLSSAYALDLVVGNVDRHEDNFIMSVESANGSGQLIGHVHLIDFGCADLLDLEPRPLPLPEKSPTVRIGRQIRRVHGFANTAADTLLSRVRDGRKFLLDRALFGMPGEWLPKERRELFEKWFVSAQFENRLNLIGQGLNNGTYL
ncbi:hypothetical protein QEZ47_06640 [Aminobacter anthyllidis]|uniref:HipA family kinase n=1 Tax=Aminobacter anthyllidis TaxID=1035067 RepID=UPI0024584BEA|nr:HipA family kinase [Aminobacter anthyllidis]MDH4985221.1 hypothetical protein [Aminobacter anthyllidis]